MLLKKIVLGLSVIGVFGGLAVLLSNVTASHAQGLPRLMFVQRDKVIKFDPTTGVGVQVGTVSGLVEGASIVNFKFTVTIPPNFTFDNRAGITDLDGDQIIFKNVGSGAFVFPPLQDPSSTGDPLFQVFGDGVPTNPANGLGGPLVGTYEVTATSGKYRVLFHIGDTFPYRGVAYNPSAPPADIGGLGAVYVNVYCTPSHCPAPFNTNRAENGLDPQ